MKQILLALDGGEAAGGALETTASLARAFGAEVAVVDVVPDGLAGEDASRRGRALLAARAGLAAVGIDAEVLEPAGDPATRLEQIAREGAFDAVVFGHGCAPGDQPGVGLAHAFAARVPGVIIVATQPPGAAPD